ncbi:MAG: AMP-binding protein [Gammaproteobacteria bacterium]|nr:AMP-binding protein [Gammaproteobacteria bacterium]
MPADKAFPSVVHMLIDAARNAPGNEAVVCLDERLNYRAYLNCVLGFAEELTQIGVRGERVALVLGNSLDICIAMFGSHLAGAQVVPMNPMYTENELRPMLLDAEVKVIIYDKCNQTCVEKLADELKIPHRIFIDGKSGRRLIEWKDDNSRSVPERLPKTEELAMLQFTGGTTGRAKGANLSHGAIAGNIHQTEVMQQPEMDCERNLCVMPLFHCYAWSVCLYNMCNCRGCMVIIPRYQPDEVLSAFSQEAITIFAGSPTLFTGLMNYEGFQNTDFSTLKLSNSGSAPLAAELLEKWESTTGTPIYEGYGQTEASPVISFNPKDKPTKSGSVGVAIPETVIEIVSLDGEDRVLPANEKGEIRLRGPQVMSGYRNLPEETAQTLRDGWLYTGDVGYLDEDSYLFITARKKEMLLVSGFNVFPREIEEVLFLHSGIKEAAVVGKSDAYRGELPVAFIVENGTVNLDAESLTDYCEKNLARYKVPDEFRKLEALPKTAVGKVDKVALSALAETPSE